jgi:hypothetical protein
MLLISTAGLDNTVGAPIKTTTYNNGHFNDPRTLGILTHKARTRTISITRKPKQFMRLRSRLFLLFKSYR